jgi:transcriptional regulator NrdR family protein
MTGTSSVLRCPCCQTTDIRLVDDNDADYPETRVEWYRCQQCSNEFTKVLIA